jgi:hypothetical protein
MRKAAGILLTVFGVAAMSLSIVNVGGLITNPYEDIMGTPPDYVYIIIATLAVFFIVGGVFCLRRKCWRLCFTSSFFLHILMTVLIFSQLFFFSWMLPLWLSLIPVWIIPLIFICLRKSEWQEILA